MDIEGNWEKIRIHRERFDGREARGLALVLFRDNEEWLAAKLRQRKDEALAVEFLGYLGMDGSGGAVKVLLDTLETGDEALQAAVTEVLKKCPHELTIEALISMMVRHKQVAVKAGEVILSYGDAGADALWKLWFDDKSPASLKARILELLTEVSDPRIERLAFLAFLDDDDELTDAALKAAERIDGRALWGNVAACLAKPSWKLRGRAVRLLGKWNESRALPYLLDMDADPDPWVEEERRKAIADIGL